MNASARLDHLVVVADSLAQGEAWCEATFGASPGPGGKHRTMGTHNRLLSIGGGAYLEIIAIDPDADRPGHPRWFGIDDPALTAAVREQPRLVHWVARSEAFDAHRAALVDLGLDPGAATAFERPSAAGLLRWRLTVPGDGRCCCAGALPSLIEWQGAHPAASMPESGVRLAALGWRGLPEAAALALGIEGLRLPQAGPAIEAAFETPRGTRRLDSFEEAKA